jgi:hypothetical protein
MGERKQLANAGAKQWMCVNNPNPNPIRHFTL